MVGMKNTSYSPVILRSGLQIYPFCSFDDLLDYAEGQSRILVAVNAEKIIHATDRTRNLINRGIGYCDGTGAVKVMKQYGRRDAVKLPGCELWLKVVERYHRKGGSFYLVGSRQEVIEAVVIRLRQDYPGICIAGYRNGYLGSEAEKQQLIDDIAERRPDVVFVAMGSPKQELLMEEMLQRHTALYEGLGGSFDVYAGRVERAPRWWLDHNLEFAYRLLRQPSRITRQVFLFKFYLLLLLRRL
ncbi:MAG: Glycosyltransferase WecB/TagA/CpsF family [bacterium P3]|nr:MAG: Glycosyltransferase WecB/TagA/CpsF family [bacterium P3]